MSERILTYEYEQIEEKEASEILEEEVQKQAKISELLKQLSLQQLSIAKISAAIFLREGKDKIVDKTKELKDTIKKSAKSFGAKAEKYAEDYINAKEEKNSLLKAYEEMLNNIDENYKASFEYFENAKIGWENVEFEAITEIEKAKDERTNVKNSEEYKNYVMEKNRLISEIQDAATREDMETIRAKTIELEQYIDQNPLTKYDEKIKIAEDLKEQARNNIEYCEDSIQETRRSRNNEINDLAMQRDEAIAGLVKQNIFQKTIGMLFNKFNGISKFKNNVIEKISETIQKNFDEFKERRATAKELREEKKEQKAEEKRLRKEEIIAKFEKSILDKQEKINELNERFNKGKTDKTEKEQEEAAK